MTVKELMRVLRKAPLDASIVFETDGEGTLKHVCRVCVMDSQEVVDSEALDEGEVAVCLY